MIILWLYDIIYMEVNIQCISGIGISKWLVGPKYHAENVVLFETYIQRNMLRHGSPWVTLAHLFLLLCMCWLASFLEVVTYKGLTIITHFSKNLEKVNQTIDVDDNSNWLNIASYIVMIWHHNYYYQVSDMSTQEMNSRLIFLAYMTI